MNGSVMPFSGSRPIIAPMLIQAWTLSQARTPMTTSWLKESGARSAMLFIRLKNATMIPSSTVTPRKPNFSAYIAKIESFAASGR